VAITQITNSLRHKTKNQQTKKRHFEIISAAMVSTRKEKLANKTIKLRQPDRSGPSEQTLLQLADGQSLFEKAAKRERELAGLGDEDEEAKLSPAAERFLEALLYTSTLAMLHFTFDVLVMNQYGTAIKWDKIVANAARAFFGTFLS
jgi:hypothetical protein